MLVLGGKEFMLKKAKGQCCCIKTVPTPLLDAFAYKSNDLLGTDIELMCL